MFSQLRSARLETLRGEDYIRENRIKARFYIELTLPSNAWKSFDNGVLVVGFQVFRACNTKDQPQKIYVDFLKNNPNLPLKITINYERDEGIYYDGGDLSFKLTMRKIIDQDGEHHLFNFNIPDEKKIKCDFLKKLIANATFTLN